MEKSDIIGIATFIAGCLLSLVLTRYKWPLLHCSIYPLLQKGTPNSPITILYDGYEGEPVQNIVRIIFTFWNSGNEAITREMIMSPLTLTTTGDACFHEANIRYSTDESNNFATLIAEDKSSVKFDFRYLDKNEGGIVEIICINVDDDSRFKFSGKIIGCRRFKNLIPHIQTKSKISLIIAYILIFFALIAIGTLTASLLITNSVFNAALGYCVSFLFSFILLSVIIDNLVPLRYYFKDNIYLMPKDIRNCFFDLRKEGIDKYVKHDNS